MVKLGIEACRWKKDDGPGIDVCLRFISDRDDRLYHVKLEDEESCNKTGDPIQLYRAATFDEDVIGSQGDWTICGESIYWSGRVSRHAVLPQLFKLNIRDYGLERKYGLKQWQTQSSNNRRPFPFKNPFVAADVFNQKLYFIGGSRWCVSDDVDGPFGRPPTKWCGECFDLRNLTWSPLDRTKFEEISQYRSVFQVAAKVKDGADEPMEIVYYDLSAGSILFLDVTDGGLCSRRVVDPEFALVQRPLHYPLPRGLKGTDLTKLIHAMGGSRSVFTKQAFYWLTFDLSLFAYDIEAKTWLKSSSLSGRLPPPYPTPPGDFITRYPLLLGLPNQNMVVIILTSPGELTVASLQVYIMTNSSRRYLKVDLKNSQAYCFDDPDQSSVIWDGEALLRNTA